MRALYDSKSKTIDDRGMKTLLAQPARVQSWLDVEAALALSQAEYGMIPTRAAENIAANCRVDKIDLTEMERLLREIGHGFVPVIKVLVKACDSESGKYVHYGVTTQNIQQTAQLYLAKQFDDIMQGFVNDILRNLAKMASDHQATLMPGRTHGKHALPVTWGYKAAVWIDELLSAQQRMQEAEKRVFTVMMGGLWGRFTPLAKLDVGCRIASHNGWECTPWRSLRVTPAFIARNTSAICACSPPRCIKSPKRCIRLPAKSSLKSLKRLPKERLAAALCRKK